MRLLKSNKINFDFSGTDEVIVAINRVPVGFVEAIIDVEEAPEGHKLGKDESLFVESVVEGSDCYLCYEMLDVAWEG